MDSIRKLAEKYGPEIAKEKGKTGEGKDGDKAGMKRRNKEEPEGASGAAK